ncbi:MAG: Tol-Pal system protein TolB [Rhizobiales bacterium]|nr:Tol-Pal system protein TolB [Hyphomicrobiales bacterium]
MVQTATMVKQAFAFIIIAIAFSIALASPATALVEVKINQGNVDPLKVAIEDFSGQSVKEIGFGQNVAAIVTNDLLNSGLFAPINPDAFLETNRSATQRPNFANWRPTNAKALVTGRIIMQPNGNISAELRLWDVLSEKQIIGLQYSAQPKNWRKLAHQISDTIYERLTGEKGYFDTRIVYVAESGSKAKRIKRLAVMDQDGFNRKFLTDGSDIVLSPRFSPKRQEVTYISYASGQPKVMLLNIDTGQRELVGNFPSMSFAPRFSPDGNKVIMSLQNDDTANLFTMDLRNKKMVRLTASQSLDTSASYSPDGKFIVFESDREGKQQLYIMAADGSDVSRVSFGGGSYSTPVWSPRGDFIAFTKLIGGQFLIGVMEVDGSGERILAGGYHNEGPTWSPNGRVLMFFRETRGETGGPSIWSVDITGRNERKINTNGFASDPAWSPLNP